MDFLAISGYETHFKSELRRIHYRQTKTSCVAYEIFSTERRFQWSKSRPSRFKETCARGHQKAVSHKSRYFTIVGKSTVNMVADMHKYAAYQNKPQ